MTSKHTLLLSTVWELGSIQLVTDLEDFFLPSHNKLEH